MLPIGVAVLSKYGWPASVMHDDGAESVHAVLKIPKCRQIDFCDLA